tara:strand:- start:305 stop:481 length:177 start_codon:yes stop_codon:yes gene_type:complete
MLNRDEKIQMIVDSEVDRMTIDDLRLYAEDCMLQHIENTFNDKEVEEAFLEVMNGSAF